MVRKTPLHSGSLVRGSKDFGCQPQVSVWDQFDLGVAMRFYILGLTLVNNKTSCFFEVKGGSRSRQRGPITLV